MEWHPIIGVNNSSAKHLNIYTKQDPFNSGLVFAAEDLEPELMKKLFVFISFWSWEIVVKRLRSGIYFTGKQTAAQRLSYQKLFN